LGGGADMKKEKNKDFDERQVWLQGKIYKYGFYFLFMLILTNTLLPAWADNKTQAYLIAFFAVTVVNIALCIFGVYFGIKNRHKTILGLIMLGICFLTVIIGKIIESEQSFIENNMLSETALWVVAGVLLLINVVCPVIQLVRDKKAGSDS
jgi:lipopolysaccharide export LptBFGC system permease protein LptF